MEIEEKILHDLMERKTNVFITGKAGSGKTYLTRKVIQLMKDREILFAVGASTGIAGRNLHSSAKTINSLLKLGIIANLQEYHMKKSKIEPEVADLVSSIDVLILEEVSMVSADFFDVICTVLKRYDFKGAILAVGDFKQLPPVAKNNNINLNQYFAFQSKHWLFKTYLLTEIKRNSDPKFNEWSNLIRDWNDTELLADPEFQAFVKNSSMLRDDDPDYIRLYSTNNQADSVNAEFLNKLEGERYISKGRFKLTEHAMKLANYQYLTDEKFYQNIRPLKETILVKGARIMMCVNDFEGEYVNGDLGTVEDFVYSSVHMKTVPLVRIDSTDSLVQIVPYTFEFEELVNGSYEVVATIEQLPLKVAYAITIHKSQGLSLSKLLIDCNNFFTPFHLYVAWSRSSDSSTLILKNFSASSLSYNPALQDLINWFYSEGITFQNDLLEKDLNLGARSVC